MNKNTIEYLSSHCRAMNGKTVVVTGANSGVGLEATRQLLFLGARVIMACRNLAKATAAREALLREFPAAELEIRQLDLADSGSIRAFAEGITRDGCDIDGFVNNAGIFRIQGRTADGENVVFGTNFTGTKLLAELLLPYLETLSHPVTMTFTTSVARMFDARPGVNYDKLSAIRLYGVSKRRLTEYAVTLAATLSARDSNVRVVLTHPGIAVSDIANKAFSSRFMAICGPIYRHLFQSAEKSALSIPLVLSTSVPSGSLYGPRSLFHCYGLPALHKREMRDTITSSSAPSSQH